MKLASTSRRGFFLRLYSHSIIQSEILNQIQTGHVFVLYISSSWIIYYRKTNSTQYEKKEI